MYNAEPTTYYRESGKFGTAWWTPDGTLSRKELDGLWFVGFSGSEEIYTIPEIYGRSAVTGLYHRN